MFNKIIKRRDSRMPPNMAKILELYGDRKILGIIIHRAPVQSLITNTLKVFGSSYDKLFHLRIYLKLQGGVTISLEKNERLNAGVGFKREKNGETMQLNVSLGDMSLNQLIEKTKHRMGAKFYTYSASSNNCQNFIDAVLRSGNVMDEQAYSFVKQSTEDIFRSRPNLRRFANTMTDIAGATNVLMQGGSVDNNHGGMSLVEELRQIKANYSHSR